MEEIETEDLVDSSQISIDNIIPAVGNDEVNNPIGNDEIGRRIKKFSADTQTTCVHVYLPCPSAGFHYFDWDDFFYFNSAYQMNNFILINAPNDSTKAKETYKLGYLKMLLLNDKGWCKSDAWPYVRQMTALGHLDLYLLENVRSYCRSCRLSGYTELFCKGNTLPLVKLSVHQMAEFLIEIGVDSVPEAIDSIARLAKLEVPSPSRRRSLDEDYLEKEFPIRCKEMYGNARAIVETGDPSKQVQKILNYCRQLKLGRILKKSRAEILFDFIQKHANCCLYGAMRNQFHEQGLYKYLEASAINPQFFAMCVVSFILGGSKRFRNIWIFSQEHNIGKTTLTKEIRGIFPNELVGSMFMSSPTFLFSNCVNKDIVITDDVTEAGIAMLRQNLNAFDGEVAVNMNEKYGQVREGVCGTHLITSNFTIAHVMPLRARFNEFNFLKPLKDFVSKERLSCGLATLIIFHLGENTGDAALTDDGKAYCEEYLAKYPAVEENEAALVFEINQQEDPLFIVKTFQKKVSVF